MRLAMLRAPVALIVVALAVGALTPHAVAGEKAGGDEDKGAKEKVTICHRTNSNKHPYVEISVGAKGALKGHARHHAAKVVWGPKLKADHERWGDIIPAFDVNGTHYDGLNLDTKGGPSGDTSGQSILDAHCKV